MRTFLKIVGAIVLVFVLAVGGFMAYDLTVNQLPADTPRVVTTSDYEFAAPDGWLTRCAQEAPGCLAVLPQSSANRAWRSRQYWIEAQSVDSGGVTDAASFVQRAREEAQRLAIANGGAPEGLIQADEAPTVYDGTEAYTLADASGLHFTQSLFVRMPSGSIQRFTCYAEQTTDAAQTSADTCFGALQQLHFPQAAALAEAAEAAAAREAEEEAAAAATRQAAAQREQQASAAARELTSRVARIDGPSSTRDFQPGFSDADRTTLERRAAQPGAKARFNRALKEEIPRVRALVQASTYRDSQFFYTPTGGPLVIDSTVDRLMSLTTDVEDVGLAEHVYLGSHATLMCHTRASVAGLASSDPAPDCKAEALAVLDRLARYAATLPD